MLSNRESFFALHGRWCLLTIVVAIASIGWYAMVARGADRWPGGGSLPGLVLGTIAGSIVLFEFALWPRRSRRFRTARWLGSAESWMKAHLWLGLLSLPLFYLHCGFRFGGTLTSVLSWCFLLVIASGVTGWVLQNILPRLLWELVPRETVFGEIDEVAQQYAADARHIVWLTCGGANVAGDVAALRSERPANRPAGLDDIPAAVARAGAVRRVGTLVERDPAGRIEFPAVPLSAALRQAFERDVHEYLVAGKSTRRVLGSRPANDAYFTALRPLVAAEAGPAVAAIADLCESRRQLDEQRRWHRLLHGWLCVHLPLSAALVILLLVHVWFALRYG